MRRLATKSQRTRIWILPGLRRQPVSISRPRTRRSRTRNHRPCAISYMLEGLEIEPSATDLAIEFLRAAHLDVPVAFADAVDGGRKLLAHGSNQHTRGGDNITSTTPLERGTSAEYTLARLDRDRPELAEQVRAGKLSANAAAIEAGFRKQPTALHLLRTAWRKANESERTTFLEEVGG